MAIKRVDDVGGGCGGGELVKSSSSILYVYRHISENVKSTIGAVSYSSLSRRCVSDVVLRYFRIAE